SACSPALACVKVAKVGLPTLHPSVAFAVLKIPPSPPCRNGQPTLPTFGSKAMSPGSVAQCGMVPSHWSQLPLLPSPGGGLQVAVLAPVPSVQRGVTLESQVWCMITWSVRKKTSKWLATPSKPGNVSALGSRPLPSIETWRSCQLTPPSSVSNWYVSPILSPGL